MLVRTATSQTSETAAPAGARVVGVRCDDVRAGHEWGHALAAEGLQTQVLAVDDRAPALADALVLHVSSGRLAEQLGRLRNLRAQSPQTPLLLAVHELRDLDQVLGLEMGADDAIDTGLAAPVVAARLRALWRRAAVQRDSEPARELRFGRLELLLLQRQVRLAGRVVPLTEGEFEVLWLLASHAGQALSRRELLRCVRGLDDHPMDRSIDSRVYRIRAKLGDDEGVMQRIRTVRNHGYVFCPVGW
jgi:two-component system, OmpR family, response regulator